jgi:hypothetical protein
LAPTLQEKKGRARVILLLLGKPPLEKSKRESVAKLKLHCPVGLATTTGTSTSSSSSSTTSSSSTSTPSIQHRVDIDLICCIGGKFENLG